MVTAHPARVFKGVVTHIALSNTGGFVLSGFSPTYLLEDGSQRRTFLKKRLKDIFGEVLRHHPSELVVCQLSFDFFSVRSVHLFFKVSRTFSVVKD